MALNIVYKICYGIDVHKNSNIQLGNVVSDTFGKSAQAILDKLLENPADISFDLESRKAELEELILALTAPYQQELAILQNAPGIRNTFSAIGIISEIGSNMEAFPSAKHLCSWAELTPTNNESAEKKNLSGSPKPDATSNHCLCSVPMLSLPVKSILKFVTAISVSKSAAATGTQSLP